MKKRILLIGAHGQLGSDLGLALSPYEVTGTTHQSLDVVQPDQVKQVVQTCRPQVIINTSAFHKVDICETEVMRAFEVNAYGIRNLAIAAREADAVLVHFSTDYVFDGASSRPYMEEDPPNPVNVYGVSKLAGEKMVRFLWEKSFVIRSSGLYGHAGSSGKGGNFVEMMLKKARNHEAIRVVDDQRLTPTSTRELARKVVELFETGHFGLYHITAGGECSWYQFAKKIFELKGIRTNLASTSSRDYRSPARRPAYSVLANARLQQLGMDDLKSWDAALQEYLEYRPHYSR